jgi:hypothetical protein
MVHLTNKGGHDTRRHDLLLSFQVLIHMGYTIDEKMMGMSKYHMKM